MDTNKLIAACEELKPCPFCGGQPEQSSGMGEHWVVCRNCKATDMHSNAEGAAKAWNTRVDPRKLIADLAAENARLERENKCMLGTLQYIQKQIDLNHPGLLMVIKQNVDTALFKVESGVTAIIAKSGDAAKVLGA